jgi:hypothetical protein
MSLHGEKQQFALHASTCGAKRIFVDGTDGSVSLSFLFEKNRYFAPQEKPRIRHPRRIRCCAFTRTTFRNCALPHDAFGVSDRADAQAEFAA